MLMEIPTNELWFLVRFGGLFLGGLVFFTFLYLMLELEGKSKES